MFGVPGPQEPRKRAWEAAAASQRRHARRRGLGPWPVRRRCDAGLVRMHDGPAGQAAPSRRARSRAVPSRPGHHVPTSPGAQPLRPGGLGPLWTEMPPLECPRPRNIRLHPASRAGPPGPRRAFPMTPRPEDEITAACHRVPASWFNIVYEVLSKGQD